MRTMLGAEYGFVPSVCSPNVLPLTGSSLCEIRGRCSTRLFVSGNRVRRRQRRLVVSPLAPIDQHRLHAHSSVPPTASAKSNDVSQLRIALVDACLEPTLNRGLSIDPDSPAETELESVVEDLAEQLEDANFCAAPTAASEMNGSWDLLYTSSTLTRFHGGVSGLHKFVEGRVGRITQEIDMESGVSTFYETISYEIPFVKKATEVKVVAAGKIRAVTATRQMWVPESIKAAWFQIWAESWKSVRAFAVAETTYLDEELRITRGQTGTLTVFGRTQI